MFYTYVLYSTEYQKIYIGQSSNLQQRLKQHNDIDNAGWTRKYQPWVIVYAELYSDRKQAMKRERELKTSRGRSFIREILRTNKA
ncbi:MAG: GIY-YIG nuclease family protein [Bacteroidetes bacterium]|nr:GIY-YIG nuclease family protein [Bacteroidota bacterium]NVO20482.1 GIY-YIG nuclease family protein [Bacteroidota bacterium]